jgi:HSP20 family protein
MLELLRTLNNGHQFAPFADGPSDAGRQLLGWGTGGTGPQADVYETTEAIRVVLDLPGHTGDNIAIQYENELLSIQAERKRTDQSGQTLLVGERGFGIVRRTFALKVPVDADRIAADYDHGVLTVTLPKRPEARPRKIGVNVKT